MAKPRRSTAEAFYDVFADMSLEDQAAALKILEQVHRLALRENKRTPMTLRLEKLECTSKPDEPFTLEGTASVVENAK